jgi:CubicO group peptidase (beta-lactamase class C family)
LDPGDPRSAITLEQLLRMTGGLEFNDTKRPVTDTVQMFVVPDMAAYAAAKPLVNEPGSVWSYSNGSSLIVSRMIRHVSKKTASIISCSPVGNSSTKSA